MKTRILAWLMALVLALSPCAASQNHLYSDPTVVTTGLTLIGNYNNAFLSLAGCNSGASAPNNLEAGAVLGQCWIDTSVTPNTYKLYDGAGNWLPVARIDATNHVLLPPIGGGVGSLTAGTTTDLGSVAQSLVQINGTTTIAGFGSSAVPGTVHIGIFNGSLTLTNSGSLLLPGGNNIVTTAGDSFIAAYLGGGNWQVIDYARASLPTKSSPATTDYVLIQDAAAGNASKKSLISSLITTMGISLPLSAPSGGTGVASPTAKTLPVNQGASAQTNIAITQGQCVTADGSGNPTAIQGCRVLLNTLTASNSANLQDTTSFTSAYNEYQIIFENVVPVTTAVACSMLLHNGTFVTTQYSSVIWGDNSVAINDSTSTTNIPCSNGSRVNNNSPGVSGVINLYGFNSGNWKQFAGSVVYKDSTNNAVSMQNIGSFYFGSAVDGIQVSFSSGNISSGTIKIYGLK